MNTKSAGPQLVDEVREMLNESISGVFSTMFSMKARPTAVRDFRGDQEMLVAGCVGFIGDINGVVYVYLKAPFAKTLASRMLSLPEAELEGHEMVNDVIGELSNMIVGAVKSRLCDSGIPCVLTIPSIVRGQNLSAEPVSSAECRMLSITCDSEPILIELLIKQTT